MTRARLIACAIATVALGTLGFGRASASHVTGVDPRVGPRARALREGATVVSTFDDLARLVVDPAGPHAIGLRAGLYHGDLTITRSLAIVGEEGATLEGTGTGTVVSIEADDVAVENVAIRHSGRRNTTEDAGIKAKGSRVRIADAHVYDALFGVTFQACHACALEHVHVEGTADDPELRGDGIKLWESHDSSVRGCLVEHARDVVVWYTRRAVVEGNVVRDGRYGTHFMYAHDAIARRNRFENDVVGVFVMYSLRLTIEDNVLAGARGAAGMGIGFKESDAVQVRRNWIVANTTGIYLDFTPRTPEQPVTLEGNVIALNDVALRLHSVEKGAIFHGNDFRDNDRTIEVDGGGDALACDVRGNHFSDYEGYDLDGDGIGDVPHHVSALSTELAEAHPSLQFFHGTTAMHLVDAVARRADPREPFAPRRPGSARSFARGTFAMITVAQVKKSFGPVVALGGVTFEIHAGERVAFVGANGSGKTTLLRALLGLVRVEGRVTILGSDVAREPEIALESVAYVPQIAPPIDAPVNEVVRAHAALRGITEDATFARAERLGLDARASRSKRFRDLSGGMKQKLLAAMALATNAPILICDEPTANLDEEARAAFFAQLDERPAGDVVVMCSHRIEEVRMVVGRVIELRDGRVARDAPVETMMRELIERLGAAPPRPPPARSGRTGLRAVGSS